jgi:hypothetical protein
MNPRGPGDQMNNKSGGDILGTMIGGMMLMFGFIWLLTVIFG